MSERMLDAHGVELCTESFGDPGDPPILLVMGLGASMLWWENGFCRMLADHGRFVIRYDHRDTGRSTTSEPGGPDYTGDDLYADATTVLDRYRISSAHLAGVSAGGGIAQLLALDAPDRVRSLTLISTSPVVAVDHELPSPTAEFTDFVTTAKVDWSDEESVVEYLVGYWRVLAGSERSFDEQRVEALVRRDLARAENFSTLQNHDLISQGHVSDTALSSIAAPTLVIHGTADPTFPLGHGEALADEIPNGNLLRLPGAGHSLWPPDWEVVAAAMLRHTDTAEQRSLDQGANRDDTTTDVHTNTGHDRR